MRRHYADTMDAMVNAQAKTAAAGALPDDGWRLKRLELQMALDLGDARGQSPGMSLAGAAAVVGGDVLVSLPAPDGDGTIALLRLWDEGASRLVQVVGSEAGFEILDESEIEPGLVGLARASIDVLERLRTDRSVIAPLVQSAH